MGAWEYLYKKIEPKGNKYRGHILFPCDPQNIKGLKGVVLQHTVRHGKILMMQMVVKKQRNIAGILMM